MQATDSPKGAAMSDFVCPKCGNEPISRKYASFWVLVDENGDDVAASFHEHQDSTELTDECLCSKCGHEWEAGDE